MKFRLFSCLLICTFFFINCKKEKFENFDDLLVHHRNNAIHDSLSIIEVLHGDWKLIHYECGGFCVILDPPESSFSIRDNNGQIYYKEPVSTELNLTFEWKLEKLHFMSESSSYQFLATPNHSALYFQTFSKDYISFDGRAGDGLFIVYEKQ